ncbi:glycerophosphodiester phosphodiesterase [Paenibacillus sp. MAH-36]|uniref:Glycerophosphodiester phosphodiesterase family protein n=1 Tax=Paenibacillus violae TaxID=3077234 RepID=A0ABU3RMV6_9BACL|nr:glycerophosphodiester phosphodiesterase family protein [Paenibacillus sp. PFR10]MDU0205568.1 glycerophosphodiester phosphodiesterase family protein [Paenibacillus sp. PFR10]
MFMNLAHRGASEYAPENTLAAFYKGLEQGANGIETDLKLSKDGVVILFHDNELDRTTNGHGLPSSYTWKELQELDAGSWFSPAYAGERLVSFEQFLHYFGRKEALFALELKDPNIELPVLELIRKYDVEHQSTITSFRYENLQAARAADPSIRLGHLIRKIDEEAIARLKEIGAVQICPCADGLEQEDVRLAKSNGFEVRAWGAFTPELMKHALQCGVDGMTINFPDKLTAAICSASPNN